MGDVATCEAPTLRFRTLRRKNSSAHRVPIASDPPQCPSETVWLKQTLQAHGLRAYQAHIAVNDPKQRRKANEISDWCQLDPMKLWSEKTKQYVPMLEVGQGRPPLRSVPIGNA
ncbi:hypothetical protein AB1Y20_021669 [Prymnesium parvum]|uniref:Uncharacterized protein n=1 Tax=Prymnesium parvum TaxID=97485 RepID=A0AB34JMV0_PRYPA|mmetsp:Transcript_26361/g.65272  ORF Transcript_26361/g.65272 Transcript_26361/m.65272 type:complete len:114 (+) Transcript_26361:79-420(+)